MSKLIILVFSLFGLFSACVGQLVQIGQCDPNVALVPNFNLTQFLGVWHEQARLDPNQNGDCVTFNLTSDNRAYYRSVNDNFLEEAAGTFSQEGNTPRLNVSISSFGNNPIPFWVQQTDYTTFALAYSCENITTSQRRVRVWVLGKGPTPINDITLALINTSITNIFGISTTQLSTTNHSDSACYVLPVIEPGQPIVLTGQCDWNLPVVQNFDVARFLGRWHQIASYDSPSSGSNCVRADYSLGDNAVEVLNSQVINGTLFTINGTATVSSNDQSAKLSVLLNIPGAPPAVQELWVLASDYDSYAISYTCVNVTSTQKQVFSWILSRTRVVNDTTQALIDQALRSYLDLNYQYYIGANQSDAACFFLPEPVPNNSVVFRGQCESVNVRAMSNFNPIAYMGLWHDIESYPTEFQGGTCSNANYTLVDGRVDVFNTEVVNENLLSINGVAMPVSTEGLAELIVSFPNAATNATTLTNYWVLDTDYTNYALVYSCDNIDADEMKVTSWKLSRTKQLSVANQTTITNIINNVSVLYQNYFQVTNQTVEGCFFYPEPQPGDPVVFPGQCDDNVAVVQNFTFQQFAGDWYEIQAYPKEEQSGQCVYHTYTFVNSTQLGLVSSSVTDQFLGQTNAVMTFNGTGTEAKLQITIPGDNGQPINIPFWILSTDYSTYAFAYACSNLNSDFRGVWSWKLSKTREPLSAAANTSINNIIENNVVLDNQYYEDIDQSDRACAYLPPLNPGDSIILPGVCDTSITGVPNFNFTRYAGRWRLIESYASDFQTGTCNVAEYSEQSGNTLSVTNSQVVNQELGTISGTATVSNDGSGKLLFYFPSRNESFELIVLDTDYESYSLGYGCVNLLNNQKRVYSWKMSRNNTLTQVAIDNMNRIINDIEVLNNRFYYTVNRTEAGCFYYPTPDPTSIVKFRGQCNDLPVVTNFNATAYLGLWHDIESYPGQFQSGTCDNALYNPGNDVNVYNTQVINQTLFTINGSAVASVDGSAKLNVTFNIGGQNVTTSYWVLATDYTSYSFVYSCRAIDDEFVQITSWKLSRARTLSLAADTAINNTMSNIPVLDQRYFIGRNQTPEGCFYFPEARPGVQVVFPGECDNNIAAMPNFDLNRFQGVWNEIEAYPKDDQPGQCISHDFTLVSSNNTLNLQSYNVLNQTLNTTSGNVRFDTNDGSGRLLITIPIPGGAPIEIPYWVLSTDYDNYALVYSCINQQINNVPYRGVFSWKLSKTRELSTASNTSINNTIDNVNVLRNNYYEKIDQSDRACFYLPDLAPGEPVTLPGTCDTTITGISNFNITRYSGRWRLIESYGSNFQTGTCNVAEYSEQSGNTLSVTNSQVVNQELGTISGTATVSNDGSGKLLFYFPSRNESFELIVLDTDYESYSLGYGCVNLPNNERRVYSWKMSRNNTLTQVAIDNMNRIINDIEVLNNPFYYTVNRTEAGCFYYPTPDPTSIVKFRGHCNDLPVVTNFNATAYLGLWHDIESYPGQFQSGTCDNALYNPGNDVNVYNTQVINQTLFTINGSAVASVDGSAKLNVTFNIGGQNVTTSYWVLATDYTSYSFVYSCRAIDDEFVQITSWKLSRARTLSLAADTAINNTMSNIPVLDQRYFIGRNQTPEGCFYFPEARPGVQVVFPGECDNNIAAMPNFDLNRFQGVWNEIEAYPKDDQPGQCISHDFTLVSSNNTLNLQSYNVLNQTLNTTSGNVRFDTNDGSGRLLITIPIPGGAPIEIPYWVLSTDYDNYALVYSCINQQINNVPYRGVFSWKLSKTKELSAVSNTSINNAIENVNVLRNNYYEKVDQSDQACFHLPDIETGDSVILPGQCDNSITGVANFNLTRYAGRWRLIESYGSRFQTGTCNVARYTLVNNNTISVVNSQVVNEALGSISGSANVSSTDGTGRLLFYLRNRYYELIILDTDYDSYSLAYGCTNMANNQRAVTSWKFSRENTLSAAAHNSINQIIDKIEVLHQPYYYTVNRTESGCFYFPPADRNVTVRFRGQCDENIPVVNNFNVTRYLGLWHDIESYPMPFQDGTCPNAKYEPYNSTSVAVLNTQVVYQTLGTINGIATVAFNDGTAKLNVTFNVLGINVTTNYWVLDTDYDSYALVYSCANIDDEYMSVASWKLSRTKALTQAASTSINRVMENFKILDQRYYVDRNHSAEGCFYFPEPEPGVQRIFPGQCDENIAAQPVFNMSLFQGLWHEIEAYPKDEQTGECVSHRLTQNATDSLRLDSFSVLNQTLSTTIGYVTFNTSDGSGRLKINIVADGQNIEIPYWILNTDYNNYALAYACVNLNDDYRKVWSWKLSRTKELSPASNIAINNATSSIPVLSNEYYEDIQQSDGSCFYLPELGPTDPVVFPGQCDPNIRVMQNFNASRYLGTWRLIESYYSEFQEGTCNTANYSEADDGSAIVFNTKVVDQQLNTITGRAVLATVDGSGKIEVTFPSSADPIELWILDTDYDSYALLYTCVNITNSDQRRVYSWKMSRTNSLTSNATTTINQIVNSIDVLNDRYYQTINRTDAGCFYFPTPDSTTNVVFPGQCDENIPAQAAFNATAYEGTWYDIESYPTNFQRGTCNTANYTVNADGSINVLNTQVVNQLLATMNGVAVLASTDGSAQLNVTFNLSSGNVTTKYWILSTDYTTYSLVYSCRNIDDYSRAVYTWKLSRGKTLPETAINTINNVLDTVEVLDQKYYVERDHSTTGCFFYPNLNGGDVILSGQCVPDDEVQAVNNFNPSLFAGTWYEVARFPSALQNYECSTSQYSLTGNGSTFEILKTSVNNEQRLNTTIQGSVASGRGVISINVEGVPFSNIFILSTDNTNYALAYSCRNLTDNRKQVYSWKLSKSREGLSVAANNTINQIVNENIDLFETYYRETAQDYASCFYYPEFDGPQQTIVLPGPCNTTIRGIPNFNTAAYLGRWYELSRYPQTAQSGQCNRAEYSPLTGGLVSVRNSQVIAQNLSTIIGQARVVSTDGSGLLEVNFMVGNENRSSNYYVLATDYINYALVYTCVNVSNGAERRVGSWILSRNTELNQQAYAVINPIIDSTQGLKEDYYQTTSQSAESCFYVPAEGQQPLFRARCENITRMRDFDLQRYVGLWHEMESYDVESEVGNCRSSRYEPSGNTTVQVVDTNVFSNQTASTLTSTMTADSNGVIRKVTADGHVQEIVVLDTDYTTYALLYSCEEVNDEYIRVWSAKHSRTRTLTPAAEEQMRPIIEENRLLHPRFYKPVLQNDNVCFHYPVQTGAQVIIPGQCDLNIPVVRTFDVNQFEGTWYQIERYDEVGTTSCIGARLNYDSGSGNTTVLAFEVNAGELNKTEGVARLNNSTDTRGIFTLVMPAANGTTKETTLYVLTTDYTSYALVYSCENEGDYFRKIGAWKLSRERTLSTAGTAGINIVVTARPELHPPYFKAISHDPDCPEPSSAFIVKSSIIVILVCAVLQVLW